MNSTERGRSTPLAGEGHPIIRPRSQHPISRTRIDSDALKVLYRLHNSGFRAYLVGGSVRDLLLGRRPKDFDIGTDAHPQQIRALFRNCRLIGRRFRLAHILFSGGKVIEVATFRRPPDLPAEGVDLLVTSDNTFGTAEEDARRRDFTINGLFYDIADFSVIDYVGGLADLDAGLVRTIGPPDIRFREDPVRMLRAVEFASRLSFAITPEDYETILRHRGEIRKSAAPRVTEEIAEMLRGGHALPTFLLLREVGLLDALLPELADELRRPDDEHPEGAGHLFWSLIEVLDAERRGGRPFDDAVSFSTLFLPILRRQIDRLRSGANADAMAVLKLIEDIVTPIAVRMSFPNLLAHRIKQALFSLGKLSHPPEWKAATRRFVFHSDFPIVLDLFELRAMATGRQTELARQWRDLADRLRRAAPTPATSPHAAAGDSGTGRRRRPRRRGGRKHRRGGGVAAGTR
jgi:poly(A) polymerase